MAFLTPLDGNTADSTATSISWDLRPADPFTNTGLTFTQITASTSEDWSGFYVSSAQGSPGILTIWTGASSSEVLIASMPGKNPMLAQDAVFMYVPIPVPSGTRLSVAFASAGTATINEVQISGVPSSNFSVEPTFTNMDCGPFLLSGSGVTYADSATVDPGGTANTLGSYTELSHTGGGNDANNILNGDSLGQTYEYLGFLFSDNKQNQTEQDRLWTLAHGAASSEVDFITELYDRLHNAETNMLNHVIWIPWGRSSGDRISARMQCSITDAADRLGQVWIFGLR